MMPEPATAEQPKGVVWHRQSGEDVLAKLGSAATGLSAAEATKRLAVNGPNELKEGKRISPWQIFLGECPIRQHHDMGMPGILLRRDRRLLRMHGKQHDGDVAGEPRA